MNSLFRTTALLALWTSATHGQVVINEVRTDDPGSDDFEYFELFNRGGSARNLGTITYLVIGDGAGGSGVIEVALSLPSVSVSAGGYFLVSNQPMLRIDHNADGLADYTAIPDFETPLQFENSDNVTHALVVGFTGAVDDDLDTDDDGTLDSLPWVAVLDAVSFYDADDEDLAYATQLGPGFENVGPDGSGVPRHIFRAPDGGAWNIGDFGQELDSGNGNLLQNSQDTPRMANPSVTPLLLTLSESSVSEGAANPALTGTVTRSGTSGDVALTVTISDESEALSFDSVFLFAGESSAVFNIEVVNDLYPDGAQSVTVTVSAPGFAPAEGTFEVTDDGDSFSVVINEVYYANDPASGDVNGDSIADNSDHFIELVNVSAAPIDLSGYHFEESAGTEFNPDGIHRFNPGTILNPGCAILVFGGAGVQNGTTAAFQTAEVQISSNNGLFLSDTGETLRLFNPSGEEVHGVALPDITGAPSDGSYTLTSEGAGGDPSLGYDRHLALSTGNDLFSPGTVVDGDPFCSVRQSLRITLLDGELLTPIASIPENALPGSVVARIEAPDRMAGEVINFRISSDLGDLTPTAGGIGSLDDGNPSIDWFLDPVDNTLAEGNRIETMTVIASNYLNAEATIEVADDGDLPPFTELVINEVDADQTGNDDGEFVELYNLTGLERPLDGLVLVLINGNGNVVYRVADLSGFSIPAHGFFVVGLLGVPNLDFTPPDWPSDNAIQNGADAVALYQGSGADFPDGTPVTDITNPLIDAVVYDTNDADDEALIAALTPGQAQINENENNARETESIQRLPDGGTPLQTSTYVTQAPTPGTSNSEGPPEPERLVSIDFVFLDNLVVATVSGLQAGIVYGLEASADGGENFPFELVDTFSTDAPNVIDGGDGVFQVEVFDGFLADLVTNPVQIYRVIKP